LPSVIRHFVVAFLIAALIFGIAGAVALGWFGKAVRNKEQSYVTDETDTKNETEDDSEEGSGSEASFLKGQSFSMLLILNDYQPDRYHYGIDDNYTGIVYPKLKKADTLLYLRFSRESASLYTAVIPSKTQVKVDGVDMTLAEAYHYKDAAYICNKVSSLLGTKINYYCSATYDEFVSFINGSAMNGVTLNVPNDMRLTLRSGTTVNLTKGSHYMDGEQALALIREEGISNNETRSRLRMDLIYKVLEKLTTLENKRNPEKFHAAVLAPMTTNLGAAQIIANVDMMFAYFELEKKELTVPGKYDVQGNFIVNSKETLSIFRTGAVLE